MSVKPRFHVSQGLARIARHHSLYQNCLGYWVFNEGGGLVSYNTAGGGNNIALTAGPTWATGLHGSDVLLDGADDYLDAGDVPGTDNGSQLTIAYRIKPTTLGAFDGQLAKWELSFGDTNNTFAIRAQNTAADEVYFFIAGNPDSGNNALETTNLDLAAGVWADVVGVYNGSLAAADRAKMYKNGIQVGSSITGTIPTTLNPTTSPFTFGREIVPGQTFFDGAVDWIAVWNRELSLSEIQGLTFDPFVSYRWAAEQTQRTYFLPSVQGGAAAAAANYYHRQLTG